MMYNKLRRRNAELTEKNRLLKERLVRAEAKAEIAEKKAEEFCDMGIAATLGEIKANTLLKREKERTEFLCGRLSKYEAVKFGDCEVFIDLKGGKI